MGRQVHASEHFHVDVDVAERLAPYEVSYVPDVSRLEEADDDLVERAATLLLVMPGNQRRETIEALLCPNDPGRGRRAVDALIDAALAAEDDAGRLRATPVVASVSG
jgi:hypothetical protein